MGLDATAYICIGLNALKGKPKKNDANISQGWIIYLHFEYWYTFYWFAANKSPTFALY